MSPTRKQMLASPSPQMLITERMRSAVGEAPAGAISSSVMLSRVKSTVSAPSLWLRHDGAPEQQFIGGRAGLDIRQQHDDVVQAGDHPGSPLYRERRLAAMPRFLRRNLWKQSPRGLRGTDLFHTDRHRRGAVRNLVGIRARHHVIEGAVEDLIFAPCHFLFFPEQLLQILHPFEIADHDAAGITEDVRYQENFILTFFQYQIRVRRGRAIGAFRQYPALQ